jgi:hypothetical protein
MSIAKGLGEKQTKRREEDVTSLMLPFWPRPPGVMDSLSVCVCVCVCINLL